MQLVIPWWEPYTVYRWSYTTLFIIVVIIIRIICNVKLCTKYAGVCDTFIY